MRLLYLSPDMAWYGGAQYQHDVMQELARQAQVFFYGPGFPAYDPADTIERVLARAPWAPDAIVTGHAWLQDSPGAPIERFPHIDLARTDVPKAGILNKEYTNLAAKLGYFRSIRAGAVFSHHHDASAYSDRVGAPAVFWPFAADRSLFYAGDRKTLDLGFSGILQNPTPGNQSDLRVRLMKSLFVCEGDVPIEPLPWCRHLRLRFNALPRDDASKMLAEQRGIYKRLDTPGYAAFVRSCRSFICTKSPADLVSPRYFECMLSGTLVFAERNAAHPAIFPPGCLLEFSDESEFAGALAAALEPGAAATMVDRAHQEAAAKHTWQHRIATLLRLLRTVCDGGSIPDRTPAHGCAA
jgi:hypothetical protein